MTRVDVVDEVFVAAGEAVLREQLCEEFVWRSWFSGARFVCRQDRGSLGKRWAVSGSLIGTAEVWLEAVQLGTIVHVFLQVDPSSGRRQRRPETYARRLRAGITTVKIELDRDRPAGTPGAGFPRPRPARRSGRVGRDDAGAPGAGQETTGGQPDDE